MINNDTNNTHTNNTNINNNTSSSDTSQGVRIPTTETPTLATIPTPKRRRTRLPSTFTFRKLLIYIRVLILALALISLILDAITISFQTNVMDLGYSDVSRQAFLILTPDLLAIWMIAFLLIYPSSLCCGSNESDYGGQGRSVVEEEYYDYGEEEDATSQNQSEGRVIGGPTTAVATTAGTTIMTTTRSQAQQQQQQQQDDEEEEDSLQRRRRFYNPPQQNTGSSQQQLHSHQQLQPLPSAASHSHQMMPNLASGGTTTTNGRQQLLHSQDHDRITTTTIDTAATLSPPCIIVSQPTKPTNPAGTGTGDSQLTEKPVVQEQPTPISAQPPRASLAEIIAQEEMNETKRKRKRARLYTIARVVFSLGLTILALYWPAGQFKPNVANTGIPLAPAAVEGENQSGTGNNSISFDHIPSAYPPPPPPPSRQGPSFTSVATFIPTPTSTGTIAASATPGIGSNSEESSINSTAFSHPFSASRSTKDYYIGGRHNRKGRQKDQHWCTEEESYGDDESATVYCRSKAIRPVVTYIWSVFLVVELCIAALAGDFSKHGIRRRRYRDFGDDNDVGGEEAERDLEKEEEGYGRSVQSLVVSEENGAGTGAIRHQQEQERSGPGGRAVH